MKKRTKFEKARFVGDHNPDLMRTIKVEDEKAKNAKAGHWISGWWEFQDGKPVLIPPRFIED
jgi:hypothetical protein